MLISEVQGLSRESETCATWVCEVQILTATISLKGMIVMSPREKEYTERINVFFSKEQMEQVKAEADKLGLTVSAYVRMVVMKEVNRDA